MNAYDADVDLVSRTRELEKLMRQPRAAASDKRKRIELIADIQDWSGEKTLPYLMEITSSFLCHVAKYGTSRAKNISWGQYRSDALFFVRHLELLHDPNFVDLDGADFVELYEKAATACHAQESLFTYLAAHFHRHLVDFYEFPPLIRELKGAQASEASLYRINPAILSLQESHRVLEIINATPALRGVLGQRIRTLAAGLINTGCRRSEFAGLLQSEILTTPDNQFSRVQIRANTLRTIKTETSRRVLPVSADLSREMPEWGTDKSTCNNSFLRWEVEANPNASRRFAYQVIARANKDVTGDEKSALHALRGGFATENILRALMPRYPALDRLLACNKNQIARHKYFNALPGDSDALSVGRELIYTSLALGHKRLLVTLTSYFPFVSDLCQVHANQVLPKLSRAQEAYCFQRTLGAVNKMHSDNASASLGVFFRRNRYCNVVPTQQAEFVLEALAITPGDMDQFNIVAIWQMLATLKNSTSSEPLSLLAGTFISPIEDIERVLRTAANLQVLTGQVVFSGLSVALSCAYQSAPNNSMTAVVKPPNRVLAVLSRVAGNIERDSYSCTALTKFWQMSADVAQGGLFFPTLDDLILAVGCLSNIGIQRDELQFTTSDMRFYRSIKMSPQLSDIELIYVEELKGRGSARFPDIEKRMRLSVRRKLGGLQYQKSLNEILFCIAVMSEIKQKGGLNA